MKKCLPILMLTLLTGCNEPKHVSGADFKREWELRDAQTMVCSEYLGEKDGKVFLRRKTMSLVSKDRWNEEVWYTEINNLDLAFLERVKKEKVPGQAVSNAVPQPTPETGTVRGELKFYPSNVKSAEAWYGHNFVVAGTPILPTEQVPEDTLKKFVGTLVTIQGVWQPGTRWKPSEEEKNMQMPVDPDKDVVIVGDGLKAQFIAPLER